MTRITAGLYSNVFDFSEYAPQLGLTTFLVVGGATKGDLNKPTLCTNEADLIRKVGPPVLNDYGIHAAIQYLKKSSRVMFMRVADATVATADAVLRGGKRAVGSIVFQGGAVPADGNTLTISDGTISVLFEFDSNSTVTGTNTPVHIVSGNAYATLENLRAAIAASALDMSVSILMDEASPTLKLVLDNFATGNAIVSSHPVVVATGFTGGSTDMALVTISAKTPGTWGNNIRVEVRASTDVNAAEFDRDVLVWAAADLNAPMTVVERFNRISLDPTSPRFLELVLSDGIINEVRKSQYISADVTPAGDDSLVDTGVLAVATATLGALGFTRGADGIDGLVAADYIGTVSGSVATGLKAIRNPERYEFNVMAVPGISDVAVINEMKSVAAYRGDCQYLVDPPLGLDRDTVIDWHNGISEGIPNAPTAPLDDANGYLCWSWVKQYCPYNKRRLFMPPSGFVAANKALTANTVGAWFITAGQNRGLIDGEDVEYSPDREDRELLCQVNGTNCVNPIVNFLDTGLTLYGNRTLQRRLSALGSEHVVSMLKHILKVVATATKYLVFEPNDQKTWQKYTDLVNPILENIAAKRGLAKFYVICDETTNPPEQRNNKTMRAKIKLEPVLGAEIIEQDFNVYDSGVELIDA